MGLLRTDALRCHAVLLSEAAAQLQRRARRSISDAEDILEEATFMALVLGFEVQAAETLQTARRNAYHRELLSELRSSRLLDHWARLVLLLCGWEGSVGTRYLCGSSTFLLSLLDSDSSVIEDSPCLSYLLSSHTVRLAAALDGGPTYGTPEAAAEGAAPLPPLFILSSSPLLQPTGGVLCTHLAQWALGLWTDAILNGDQELCADLRRAADTLRSSDPSDAASVCAWRPQLWRLQVRPVRCMVGGRGDDEGSGQEGPDGPVPAAATPPEPLRRWVGCAAVPPLHTRAAFEVSLRLAAAAVSEMERQGQAQQERTAEAGSARSNGSDQMRMSGKQAGALAFRALHCARAACQQVAERPCVPGWVQRRLERFWRVLLAAVECGQHAYGADGCGRVGEFWSWKRLALSLAMVQVLDPSLQCLPPVPSADITAALSAGFPTCLERLLRRGEGAEPFSAPRICVTDRTRASAAWGQVLAFGPRPAVFSLLATAAKRVRRAAIRHAAGDVAVFREGGWALELLVSDVPLRWLLRLAEPERGPNEGAEAASSSPAATQLRQVLSFTALHLAAPLLCDLPHRGMRPSASLGCELLAWLPLLAAARACGPPGWAEALPPDLIAAPVLAAAVAHVREVNDPELRPCLASRLHGVLWTLLHLAPQPLADVLRSEDTEPQGPQGHKAAGGVTEGVMAELRRLLGPGGEVPEPGLLAALERLVADAAAARTVGGGGGGSDGRGRLAVGAGGGAAGVGPALPAEVRRWVAAAALLVPPAELEAALPRRCANPRCTNLAGDSEAALPLHVVCGGAGCGLAYCSAGCRQGHAGTGHREACCAREAPA